MKQPSLVRDLAIYLLKRVRERIPALYRHYDFPVSGTAAASSCLQCGAGLIGKSSYAKGVNATFGTGLYDFFPSMLVKCALLHLV
jgi:hypothetical protein